MSNLSLAFSQRIRPKEDIVRSGDVILDYGAIRGLGNGGRNWSNTAVFYTSAPSAFSYYFFFNPVDVLSSASNVRWYAFPVRCLVY